MKSTTLFKNPFFILTFSVSLLLGAPGIVRATSSDEGDDGSDNTVTRRVTDKDCTCVFQCEKADGRTMNFSENPLDSLTGHCHEWWGWCDDDTFNAGRRCEETGQRTVGTCHRVDNGCGGEAS